MAQSSLLSRFSRLRSAKPQEDLSSVASFRKSDLRQLNDSVYEVYNPPGVPEVEVVFFHGMLEDFEYAYYTTWLSEDNSQMWLKTWLIGAFPAARILTVSYDSAARNIGADEHLVISPRVKNLLSDLTALDEGVGQAGCPVVLVGYCEGGMMLKRVCLMAAQARRGKNPVGVNPRQDFLYNLRGMFYFNTAHLQDSHYGSNLGRDSWAFSRTLSEKFKQLRVAYRWRTAGICAARGTNVNHLGKSRVLFPETAELFDVDEWYTDDGADRYNISRPKDENSYQFVIFENFLREIVEKSRLAKQYRPAKQYLTRKLEKEDLIDWYHDPISYAKMCDPVKCSDGTTYDRWTILEQTTLSILCDDLSVRFRLFQEFPEQETKFIERRARYRAEAWRHACGNEKSELHMALEMLKNVLDWQPLDTECQEKISEIQKMLFTEVPTPETPSKKVPTLEMPTENRLYEIPVISHEDVISAKGRDFDTQLVNFLIFLCIGVCFFISSVKELSICHLFF